MLNQRNDEFMHTYSKIKIMIKCSFLDRSNYELQANQLDVNKLSNFLKYYNTRGPNNRSAKWI